MSKALLIWIMILAGASAGFAAPKMKTVEVGKTALLVDLPEELIVDAEGDHAISAYLPYKAFVTLRFDVTTISTTAKDEHQLGFNLIKNQAAGKKLRLFMLNDRCFYQETCEIEQDGEKTIRHSIYVGYGNFAVVISCSILSRMKDDPTVVRILEYTGPAIRTLQKKPG